MCAFCDIVAGTTAAEIVFDDEQVVAFLDTRPLFPGHTLVVPRGHYETLTDLPGGNVPGFFSAVRLLAEAVPRAMESPGSFIAMNNKVSQSVPHLHAHVVPRRFKDGLKGFFWPRQRYTDEDHLAAVGRAIRAAVVEGA